MGRMISRFSLLAFTVAGVWAQAPNPYLISTFAGNFTRGDGGPAITAFLESPLGVAGDSSGAIYFIDQVDSSIRRIANNGVISTVARVENAQDLTVLADGSIIVATGASLQRVTSTGAVTRIAGTNAAGSNGDGGQASAAAVAPFEVSADSDGNIYLVETNFHKVRRIDENGVITTIAGTGQQGYSGDGGPATQARLAFPTGVAADSGGAIYISDDVNGYVRKIAPDGTISSFAGNGGLGIPPNGAQANSVALGFIANLSVDAADNLLVCDYGSGMIYRITTKGAGAGTLRIVAGAGVPGFSGDGGQATAARLRSPLGVFSPAPNIVVIADTGNHRIRRVLANGTISTLSGRSRFGGDGGPAVDALLFRPSYTAHDSAGNTYLSDSLNHRIRRVDPAGRITTFAGSGTRGFTGDGGPANVADLNTPFQIVAASDGTIYFVDSGNSRIRRIRPDGTISTVAGSDEAGDSGDGGQARDAKFRSITGLAIDPLNNLYIADAVSHKVRRIDQNGVIRTLAGTGVGGLQGNGGQATAALLRSPSDLTVDSQGALYINDFGNLVIRRVTGAGVISTYAGNSSLTLPADGGPATSNGIAIPAGLATDADGTLFISGFVVGLVFAVTPEGTIYTIAGGGPPNALGDGGPARLATLLLPFGLSANENGDVFISDLVSNRVRRLRRISPAALQIAGGNDQAGPAGEEAAEPLRVRVTDESGAGVANVTVAFEVTSGDADLAGSSAQTNASGVATMGVTFGQTAGEVTITAEVAGLPPVAFTLTVVGGSGGGSAPRIFEGGIGGAGLSVPPVGAFAANMIASIFGERFAPAGTLRAVGEGDLVGGRVPTILAGVCVLVNGERAPILLVSPGQINFILPAAADGAATVRVVIRCGEQDEAQGNVQDITMAAASPEFFYFVRNADGRNPVAAIDAVTGGNIGAPNLVPDAAFTEAKPLDLITAFGTGFGDTTPEFEPGEIPVEQAAAARKPTVTLGGVPLADEDVLYAGISPILAGVYQLSIRIPADTPDGDHALVIRFGDASSPAGAYVTVRRGN